ncbi:MAG: LysM peptidoglycan-binding domain-containing protein, partial [candidate division NC10 bacterium]|nr:LysM peptidoglycan-binding domain-containing protein [candidate division NC10 bacterium]
KAAYEAAQEEIARLKAAPVTPAPPEAEAVKAACAAEKAILLAEGAEQLAAAVGAKQYSLVEYDQGQQMLAQAKDDLAASAFVQSEERAQEATRLFRLAADRASRAREADQAAQRAECERALAEARAGYGKAVSEELERCAKEKQALREDRDRVARELEECRSKRVEVAPPAAPPMVHTVQRGDCLWNIAETIYGNPYQWPVIFWANRDQIRNPDLIHPRQELKIPRDLTQDEINRAIKEASERPWPRRRR